MDTLIKFSLALGQDSGRTFVIHGRRLFKTHLPILYVKNDKMVTELVLQISKYQLKHPINCVKGDYFIHMMPKILHATSQLHYRRAIYVFNNH